MKRHGERAELPHSQLVIVLTLFPELSSQQRILHTYNITSTPDETTVISPQGHTLTKNMSQVKGDYFEGPISHSQ